MADTDKSRIDKAKNRKDSQTTLYCSFCGKSQHEVRKLIAGPTVFICDECVTLCMDIIREERPHDLTQLKTAADQVDRILADAGREVPGNTSLKMDLAQIAVRRLATGRSGRVSGLCIGPSGCGVERIIASIWSFVNDPVVSLDASQLRTTRLFGNKSVGLLLLEAADFNLERAGRGVVVIDNLDRIAGSGDEFRLIQEELELMIRGITIPVESSGDRRSRESLLLDTAGISFFACTSVLHASVQAIAVASGGNGQKHGDARRQITDALTARRFVPELINAFDHIYEFGPITGAELAAYLERPDCAIMQDWHNFIKEIGGELEPDWAAEVMAAVQRQGTGLRGLKGILGALSVRLAFEWDGARAGGSAKVTADWIRNNL